MPKTIKESLESILATQRHLVEEGFHSRIVADEKVVEVALAEIRQLLEECQPTHAPARIWEEDTASAYELGAEQYWDNIEKRLG